MNLLIQQLSNPSQIDAKFILKLNKLLKDKDTKTVNGRKGKENNSNIATKGMNSNNKDMSRTAFAFLVLQTMAKHTLVKLLSIDSKTLDSHFQMCHSLMYTCVSVLEQDESSLNSLDLEKMICNLVNRYIELKKYECALELIWFGFIRLDIKPVNPCNVSAQVHTNSNKSKTTTKKEKTLETIKSNWKKSNLNFKILNEMLVYESKQIGKSIPKLCILVTLMTHTLRIWVEIHKDPKMESQFKNQLLVSNGLNFWCFKLKSIDASIGSKHYDNIYRILYKSSMVCESPLQQLQRRQSALTFYIHSVQFSMEYLNDSVFKFATLYKKSMGYEQHALMEFYKNFIQILESLANNSTNELTNLDSIVWIQEYILLSKSRPSFIKKKKNSNHLQTVNSFTLAFILNELQILTQSNDHTLLYSQLISWNIPSLVWDCSLQVKEFKRLIQLLTMFSFTQECMQVLMTLVSHLLNISCMNSLEYKDIKKQIMEILEKSSVFASHLFDKYPLLLNGSSLLEAMNTMACHYQVNDTLLWISMIRFNLAGFLYSLEMFFEAQQVLKESILNLQCFNDLSSSHGCQGRVLVDEEESKEKQKEFKEKQNMLISKRFNLLSMIQFKLNSRVDSFTSNRHALKHFPFTNHQESSLNLLSRLLDRHVLLAQDLNSYESIMDYIPKESFPLVLQDFVNSISTWMSSLMKKSIDSNDFIFAKQVLEWIKLQYSIECHSIESSHYTQGHCACLLLLGHVYKRESKLDQSLSSFKQVVELISKAKLSLEVIQVQMEAQVYIGILLNELNQDVVLHFEELLNWMETSVLDFIQKGLTKGVSKEISNEKQECQDKIQNHLKLLSSYTQLLYQPFIEMKCARILLKWYEMTFQESEKIQLLIQMSLEYIRLGYSGYAQVYLDQIKSFIELQKEESKFKNDYLLAYIGFLVSTGQLEICKKYIQELENGKVEQEESTNYILSLYYMEIGCFSKSISYAESGHLLLYKKVSTKFNSNKWNESFQLLKWYQLLGQVYHRQGSYCESKYFYKRGLDLSCRLHLKCFSYEFELNLTNLNGLSCVSYDEFISPETLEEIVDVELANSIQSMTLNSISLEKDLLQMDTLLYKKGMPPTTSCNYYLILGDEKKYKKQVLESRMNYELAQESLSFFMEKDYIDSLSLDFNISSTNSHSCTNKNPSTSNKNNKAKTKTIKSSKRNVFYKCTTLQQMQVSASLKLCHLFQEFQQYKECKSKLKQIQSKSLLNKYQETQLYGIMALLKLNELYSLLNGNMWFEVYKESVYILPWNLVQDKATTSQALSKKLSNLQEVYVKFYELARKYGSSQQAKDASHGLLSIKLLSSFNGSLTFPFKDFIYTILEQFESCQGISWTRELQTLGSIHPIQVKGFEALENQEISKTRNSIHEIQHYLPRNTILISLSYNTHANELILSRTTSQSDPILCKIPLKRGNSFDLSYQQVLNSWKCILKENNDTTHSGKEALTPQERMQWWEQRRDLDLRLQNLLISIEQHWLSVFKGLLAMNDSFKVYSNTILLEFKKEIHSLLIPFRARQDPCKVPDLNLNFLKMLLELDAKTCLERELQDALYYIVDLYANQGISIQLDELSSNTTHELRNILYRTQKNKNSFTLANSNQSQHVILVLDKHLQMFPWESIPILRNKSVSRMPSFTFALKSLERHSLDLTVNSDKTFYLLNPSGDLENTQREFQEFALNSRKNGQSWNGRIGESCPESELANALASHDLFLYFGHGGAEQFIKGSTIKQLKQSPVALLMGCSSGLLHSSGEFDPWGTVLNYLMSGSKAVVANLMDVTDKDIDRFSKSVLTRWGLYDFHSNNSNSINNSNKEVLNICESVVEARDSCILKYLVGSSPVVYGLPVVLTQLKDKGFQ